MEEMSTPRDEAAEAVATYLGASRAALESLQRLQEAWKQHFEGGAQAPSADWIAEVAAQQRASDLALGRARMVVDAAIESPTLIEPEGAPPDTSGKTRRRRRRENKFLRSIGKPGQRVLRAVVLLALLISGLVAGGAGISLALEIAGFLRLIEDPVQLPVGIQLAIFVLAAGAVLGLRSALKSLERALYGSKGLRPKNFSL